MDNPISYFILVVLVVVVFLALIGKYGKPDKKTDYGKVYDSSTADLMIKSWNNRNKYWKISHVFCGLFF